METRVVPNQGIQDMGKTYYGSYIAEFLVWKDSDGLDKKLVAAAGIDGRVLFHGLEKDCNLIRTIEELRWEEGVIPCISTVLPGSMRPELGRTQYLANF